MNHVFPARRLFDLLRSIFVPTMRQGWTKRNANIDARIAAPPRIAGRGSAPIAASGTRWSKRRARRSFRPSTTSAAVGARSRSKRSTPTARRSEEHTSELQSLMRISYAVFCLKKKKQHLNTRRIHTDYNYRSERD